MKPFLFNVLAVLFVILIFCGFNTSTYDRMITGHLKNLPEKTLIQTTIKAIPSNRIAKPNMDGTFSIQVHTQDSHIEINAPNYHVKTIPLDESKQHYSVTLQSLKIPPPPPPPAVEEVFNTKKAGRISKYPVNAKPFEDSESYDAFKENTFQSSNKKPLSTVSIDVDRASYSNMRRFLEEGRLPHQDAIRTEELLNYFNYNYKKVSPNAPDPFVITTHLGPCAWNSDHQLLQIGLQGKEISKEHIPPSNLVFLLDVSGSMQQQKKLPLLKSAFKLLVQQLRDEDLVSIVVYAGAAGTVLEPTKGSEKDKILEALDKLRAGGSTAGGAGIELAYKLAEKHYLAEGNNRIILATDGDFNVGISNNEALVRLIEQKRNKGIFLSILGFGTGNYKDSKMQKLAQHGNGNHNYIDKMSEAKKVLLNEFSSTLFTIAKDVKIQVEFNPAQVASYRLIGYESRMLQAEDFNDDQKDAGEMGAGHQVTFLYEIIPPGVDSKYKKTIHPLKYQKSETTIINSKDVATVKYRYKLPKADRSIMREHIVKISDYTTTYNPDFIWASSIAGYGMLLKASPHSNDLTFEQLQKYMTSLDPSYLDKDRLECLELIEIAKALQTK